MDLDMNFFYDALTEQNYIIEFQDELDVKHFENYIQQCYNNLNNNNDDIWQYLIEEAENYCYENDGVTITKED